MDLNTTIDLFQTQSNLQEITKDGEDCGICRENMNPFDLDKPLYTLKKCNHTFHVECIIDCLCQLGNGECPYCRKNNKSDSYNYYNFSQKTFSLFQKYVKTNDEKIPKHIKNLFEKYDTFIKEEKKKSSERSIFLKEHKKIFIKKHELNNEIRKINKKIRYIKDDINNIPIFPVPIRIPKIKKNFKENQEKSLNNSFLFVEEE